MIFIIIITALLPVAILGWWIYRKDSLRPEPLGQLFSAFFYGVGSAFVSMVLSTPLTLLIGFDTIQEMNTIGDAISVSLLSAAIPEEIAKLTMLWLFLRKNRYYDEYLDGIIYAACVGLGFAGAENILSPQERGLAGYRCREGRDGCACPLCHCVCNGLLLQQAPLR